MCIGEDYVSRYVWVRVMLRHVYGLGGVYRLGLC